MYTDMTFTISTPNEMFSAEIQLLPHYEQMCVSTDFFPQEQPEWFSAMDHRFCLLSLVKHRTGRCIMYYAHPTDYAKAVADCEQIFCDNITESR